MKQTFSIIVGLQISICAAFALLVLACGVKKDVVQQERQANKEQQTNVPSAVNDSLAYLGDLINDSTIHINYVYGIPFIIDDCVPMFLPPIDKNPVGYVSNKSYEKIVSDGNRGEKVFACGIMTPVDSLLWLNKCVNDLVHFKDSSSLLPVSHYYTYSLILYSFDDNTSIFTLGVSLSPHWSCIEDTTRKMFRGICYVFDCEGNLLGKMNVTKPVDWEPATPVGELDQILPKAENVLALLKQKCKRKILLPVHFIKFDPNYECVNYDDVIKL